MDSAPLESTTKKISKGESPSHRSSSADSTYSKRSHSNRSTTSSRSQNSERSSSSKSRSDRSPNSKSHREREYETKTHSSSTTAKQYSDGDMRSIKSSGSRSRHERGHDTINTSNSLLGPILPTNVQNNIGSGIGNKASDMITEFFARRFPKLPKEEIGALVSGFIHEAITKFSSLTPKDAGQQSGAVGLDTINKAIDMTVRYLSKKYPQISSQDIGTLVSGLIQDVIKELFGSGSSLSATDPNKSSSSSSGSFRAQAKNVAVEMTSGYLSQKYPTIKKEDIGLLIGDFVEGAFKLFDNSQSQCRPVQKGGTQRVCVSR